MTSTPLPVEERQIFEKVRELLTITVEDLTPEEIQPDSDLRDDLGVDSLARMELVAAIEDQWQIKVPMEEAEHLTTVRLIVGHLRATVPAPAGEPS
ncbi:acyl carrier protein [Streptomyces sp. NPDC006997]|uniref:acyl carrier protein n=1 Tax=Streptomyces sp. NPDC006997 TaxID=3155356 RepID=UPI0033C6C2C1